MKKSFYNALLLTGYLFVFPVLAFPQADPVVWDSLYQAQSARNDSLLMRFTHNDNPDIRQSAWRALANVEVSRPDTLLYRVLADRSEQAWFALSTQNLNQRHIRMLEQVWTVQPDARAGVSLVLGEKGDARSRDFLTSRMAQTFSTEAEFNTALAISRLQLRAGTDSTVHQRIINRVMEVDEPRIRLAWLYGYYRSPVNLLPDDEAFRLLELLETLPADSYRLFRQYLIHIAAKGGHEGVLNFLSPDSLHAAHPLVAVEAARALNRFEWSEVSNAHWITLLDHSNPVVVSETLQLLKSRDSLSVPVLSRVISLLEQETTTPEVVYIQALDVLAGMDPAKALSFLPVDDRYFPDNPALTSELLQVYMKVYSESLLIQKMMNRFDSESPQAPMAVLQTLLMNPPDPENGVLRDAVRRIVRQGLMYNDNRVAWAALQLERATEVLTDDDRVAFRDDILYLDSLNTARPTGLLVADQDLLNTLGASPVWVLETDYGLIRIRLHPDKAPATVTAIAVLTMSGRYTGGSFHRVVPNFVIQGGMIWQDDGLGGPGFTVPTEASEGHFSRGMVGVASAGRDTEGSQFFVMHQWHPHLNGRYTIFGTVIEGMEIVDRIYRGARILGATIER